MARIKIYGKTDPVVGVKEDYSIHDFFGNSTPLQLIQPKSKSEFEDQIKWSIWILVGSSWIKMTKNNKTGATVDYTFSQDSMTRKGIRMLVEANGEKAVIDIKSQKSTESNILFAELLDANYNTPTRPFTYGDKMIARVHCINMERYPITVTLWEDDGGKSKKNTPDLKIDTQKGNVLNGVADVTFYLSPNFAWLANAKVASNDPNEGVFHEYYVTAEFFEKISKPSMDVDVINPDYKEDIQPTPTKKHTESQQPAPQNKKQSPAEKKGPSKKEEKEVAKSDKKVYDYHEQKVFVKNEISSNPIHDLINSMMTVNTGGVWESKKDEKEKCFCNRDFEEKDVRKLVKLLKGSESIWEGQALKGGKRIDCHIDDKSFATLTTELNSTLKKYKINSCIQKIHFLAQVCEETGTFTVSEETKSKYASSQSIYKGRGILQLTGIKNESETYYDRPGPYKSYAEYKSEQNIVKKPEIIASNIQYAIDSGGWIWSINQKMTNNPNSQAITKWGIETLGKSLNELSIYEDKYFELISVLLNGRGNDNMPIGWTARQSYYNILKTGFFFYQRYHGGTKNPLNAKGVITYHIYSGGKIEKHIPKEIKLENKKKYKYVYHDKNEKEHVLGIFDFFLTTEMNKGNITGKNSVELIDVREFKGYSSDGIKLKFVTLNTDSKRYYINPDCYAGLLGAMADMNIDYLGFNGFSNFEAKSTGGSSSHINGEKGDLRYLSKNKKGEPTLLQDIHFDVLNQNRFNDVLYNYGWGRLEKMYSEYFTYNGDSTYLLNHTKNMRKYGAKGYRHHHHLHLSGFDHLEIKIIKE